MSRIKNYIEISKPRLVFLLYFTGLASMIIASELYGYDIKKIIIASIGIILGIMGANATTAYIDRKMDRIMKRTSKRPVPTGRIDPPVNALFFGLSLLIIGVILVGYLSYLSAVFLLLGFFDSAIIYNALTKRRSPLNILFGAPAGGMPVLVGWAAVTRGLGLIPLLMFILIIIWTPIHIWSLAYFYKEDYRKADVPMLPVRISPRKTYIILSALNSMLLIFSVSIGIILDLSIYFKILTAVSGLPLIIFIFLLIIRDKDRYAWQLFKYSSPYLAFIFLLLVLEFTFIN